MYADHTLTPKEAIRLCALGSLALGSMRYADLAISIRHFISRVIGPTPEIMGHSLELLKYEGLVETVEGSGEVALLRSTDVGVREGGGGVCGGTPDRVRTPGGGADVDVECATATAICCATVACPKCNRRRGEGETFCAAGAVPCGHREARPVSLSADSLLSFSPSPVAFETSGCPPRT